MVEYPKVQCLKMALKANIFVSINTNQRYFFTRPKEMFLTHLLLGQSARMTDERFLSCMVMRLRLCGSLSLGGTE